MRWLLALLALFPAAAAAQDAPPPAALEISLLTIGPGEIYWERFGHNAIVVHDRASGESTAYNYGMFDFDEADFLVNFARGHMTYQIVANRAGDDIAWYAQEGRFVVEQKLRFDAQQALALKRFLDWNVQPGNARYRYDYYMSNCSTRVRDALDDALGGALRRQLSAPSRGYTHRLLTGALMSPQPLLMAALDAGLGPMADRRLSFWDDSFVPMELMAHLRDVTLELPVGLFTCITGVSGSGKSTLINDTLYAAAARHLYGSTSEPAPHQEIVGLDLFDKVINVDQSPIGRTPRSNPATYTGLFTPIRELFAEVPAARERGYGPGRFSFNVAGGRCEACEGDGVLKVEMHFLPDVYVPCDVCHGRRYNRETLEILYKGKNITEVLDLTVEDAHGYFSAVPNIARKLQTLLDVGLGYIRLGQSATTLSGGEAQRVKLALELSKRDTGRTLYILDEPTTGLHFADIDLLLKVLHQLRDAGNTIVVIEHNLDVIKTADWIVDLGPEGGAGGGRIVAEGPPEAIVKVAASHTGRYLKPVLDAIAAAGPKAANDAPRPVRTRKAATDLLG